MLETANRLLTATSGDQIIQHEPVAEAADTPATHRCPGCGAPKSRHSQETKKTADKAFGACCSIWAGLRGTPVVATWLVALNSIFAGGYTRSCELTMAELGVRLRSGLRPGLRHNSRSIWHC